MKGRFKFMTEFIQGTCFVVLTALIQIIVCVAGAFLIALLAKMTKKAGLDANGKIANAINDIIQTLVVATNQTVVEELKKTNKNGKLTNEQADEIYNTVRESVYECLDSDQVAYLINQYGNVEDALRLLIEKSVNYNHISTIYPYDTLTSEESTYVEE